MICKKAITAILLIVILALPGCSTTIRDELPNNDKSQASETTKVQEPTEVQEPEKELDPIKEQVKSLTIEEKIGQMVVVGLEGYTMDDITRAMIKDYHVGGFILFSRNVKGSNQLLSLINSLKSTNTGSKVPLFISVDEEGGRVSRLPADFKKLPRNKTIGEINNPDFSYEIGGILAEETRSFGFNMNFAPVLDINSNPKNPVIGDRSFGPDKEIVSSLGIQTMRGIRAGRIIPVVKHFPGHGDTAIDSHLDLPSVNYDMERLNNFEFIPFNQAIQNQADVIMIAHILLNKIDPQNPSSLSRTVITDLLRKQLGFAGVVITDDMTMKAIIKNYSIGNAAVKSVNAGSDIILACHGYDNELAVIKALRKAVADGALSEGRIDESVYRILKLKNKYNLTDSPIQSIDVEKINNKIKSVLDTYMD